MNPGMEKIEPSPDHRLLERFAPGEQVTLCGERYTVVRRTTLATGEPALILQRDREQFVIGASRLLAGLGATGEERA
jgi:hypothetical protein